MQRHSSQVKILLVLFLLLAQLMGIGTLDAAAPAPNSQATVHFVRSPQFFMVGADKVAAYCVVADSSPEHRSVVAVAAQTPKGALTQKGNWRSLAPQASFADRGSFEKAWTAFSGPGAKVGSAVALAESIERLLATDKSYDVISIEVPVEPDVKPGSRQAITVSATLSDGSVVQAVSTLIAQSLTPPSGWILGDTHVHTDLNDPVATLTNSSIKSLAQSYGHNFTYITDHIDLIRSCTDLGDPAVRWSTWRSRSELQSGSTYTQCPGIEVTALNGDGDALGYGMPATDPTAIQNRQLSCSNLVAAINNAASGASAYIAHPAGPPLDWHDPSAAYYGVQAVDYGEVFWKNGITSGHRSAASGGSDAHVGALFGGQATWLYAPSWATQSLWLDRVSTIAAALKSEKSSATTDGGFGYFRVGSNYPGSSITASTGSTIYYSLDARALDNGYNVQITWDLYRDSDGNRVSGGTSGILGSGGTLQYSSLPTTVQGGKHGYYLVLTFDYRDDLGTVFTSYVFCGPVYVTGI